MFRHHVDILYKYRPAYCSSYLSHYSQFLSSDISIFLGHGQLSCDYVTRPNALSRGWYSLVRSLIPLSCYRGYTSHTMLFACLFSYSEYSSHSLLIRLSFFHIINLVALATNTCLSILAMSCFASLLFFFSCLGFFSSGLFLLFISLSSPSLSFLPEAWGLRSSGLILGISCHHSISVYFLCHFHSTTLLGQLSISPVYFSLCQLITSHYATGAVVSIFLDLVIDYDFIRLLDLFIFNFMSAVAAISS